MAPGRKLFEKLKTISGGSNLATNSFALRILQLSSLDGRF
jgi:hypothetical protein